MQGTHCYQPELFSQIDYGQLIPPNHLLCKIDGVLDLSFLSELTKPLYSEEVGRPSVAPDIFISMVLMLEKPEKAYQEFEKFSGG